MSLFTRFTQKALVAASVSAVAERVRVDAGSGLWSAILASCSGADGGLVGDYSLAGRTGGLSVLTNWRIGILRNYIIVRANWRIGILRNYIIVRVN